MTPEAFLALTEPGPSGCLNWTGNISRGYGRVVLPGNRHERAHRVAFRLFRGPIPEGLVLDHLCRNRRCVNPEHLEPVTIGENVLRGDTVSARRKAQTHCRQGHLLAGENLRVWTDREGREHRRCRACARRKSSDYAHDPKNREKRLAYFRRYNSTRKEASSE